MSLGNVAHNYHNCCPSQEFLTLMAIAMAEVPTTNLLVISVIEIPISRLKKQSISTRAFDTPLR
jgi:hypothetical protein